MKKILIFSAIIIIIVGVPLAKKFTSSESDKEVEIEQVSMQTIKASILASGQLKHEHEVKLTAEVIGIVSNLYVEEGDSVVKGQLVLEIDDEVEGRDGADDRNDIRCFDRVEKPPPIFLGKLRGANGHDGSNGTGGNGSKGAWPGGISGGRESVAAETMVS